MSDQDPKTTSVVKPSVAEEFFTLRLVGVGVQTVPSDGRFPLLARLHGYDRYDPEVPPNVSELINASEVLDGTDGGVKDLLSGMTDRILEIASSHGVVVDVLERTSDGVQMRLRDADEVALEGAIDINAQASEAGIPIGALLLKDGRVAPRGSAPKRELASLVAADNAKEVEERIAAAIVALSAAYPDPQSTFFGLQDFLDKQGDDTPWSFGRSLYKYTDCGPWTAFVLPGQVHGSVYYEDPKAREHKAPWWADCAGVRIGSIVEGSDAEVQPETLLWPFTQSDLDRAVRNISDEACALWDEANGETFEDEDEEG